MNQDMTKGKILPSLIRFTIPILLGDLFQQCYNIADSAIVGRTLGTGALAAVGSTGTILFLTVGICSTLANGFSVVTSQRFGAGDESGVRRSFANGIWQMAMLILVFTMISVLGIRRLLYQMNTPEDIFEDAYAYISVIMMGLPVTAFYNYFAANLRAIGNSRIPLYFLILASGLNIVFDFFFILGLHMGTAGAALATVMAQAVSALFCGIFIFQKEPLLKPSRADWKPDREICLLQLAIGIPMALQNAITASGTMIMQSAANVFGSTAVAANTAAGKVRQIFTQFFGSLGQSSAVFTGQNYGSRNMKRVRQGAFTGGGIVVLYGLITMLLSNLLLPFGMQVFIADSSDITALMPWARTYMFYCSVFYIPLGMIFVFRSALQGVGKSVFAMSAGLIELVCRIIFAYLAISRHSYLMAVFCDSAAWFGAGVYTLCAFCIISKKMMKKMEESLSYEKHVD